MRRDGVIEFTGEVVAVYDDGSIDATVPELTGDEDLVIEGIRGVFQRGSAGAPQVGQRVLIEQRYPSRDPRAALRWVGHEDELPSWYDADRAGLDSVHGRVAVVLEEDLAGDESNVPALLLGGLHADQKAVLGDVLVAKLGTFLDAVIQAVDVIANAQYGAPPGPMDPTNKALLTTNGPPAPDPEAGNVVAQLTALKDELVDALSQFVRVAKSAPASAPTGPARAPEDVSAPAAPAGEGG